MNEKSTSWQIAKIISSIGNPLVLGILYGLLIQYFLPIHHPSMVYSLLLLVVVLPVVVFIVIKVKKGTYNNYDVSHQKKRNSLYLFSLCLFVVLYGVLYYLGFDFKERLTVFIVFLHLAFSYLINQNLKISMHTSFSFLFAFMYAIFDVRLAVFFYFFGFFNAWSRLELSRHKPHEIVAGYILGNITGILFLILFNHLY